MSPTPETDELHNQLSGDWGDCYTEMRTHAMKLECRLREQAAETEQLKARLTTPVMTETISRLRLRQMSMAELVMWLSVAPDPLPDSRRITVPET